MQLPNDKWRDYRLGYHNLKDVYKKNVVLEYMVNDLWKPILVFANNNQQKIIEYGPSSCVMMIQRNTVVRLSFITG